MYIRLCNHNIRYVLINDQLVEQDIDRICSSLVKLVLILERYLFFTKMPEKTYLCD